LAVQTKRKRLNFGGLWGDCRREEKDLEDLMFLLANQSFDFNLKGRQRSNGTEKFPTEGVIDLVET